MKSKTIFFVLYFCLASSAYACKYNSEIDKIPFSERLSKSEIAFIGTVTSIEKDGSVKFKIEHLLQGAANGDEFTIKIGKSSCDINFGVGERWIYGGETLADPSMMLSKDSHEITQYFVRYDDSKLNFSKDWQECKSDVECAWIHYGCGDLASVNNSFISVAKDKAYQIGGNPMVMNCAFSNPSSPIIFHPIKLCQQNKCGIWQLKN